MLNLNTNKQNMLVLLLIVLIFFSGQIFNPSKFIPGQDVVEAYSVFHYSDYSHLKSEGELPSWWPSYYMGLPLNIALGRYYPINFMFLFSYNDSLFTLYFAIHMLIAGIFTYLFAKKLKLENFPSLIAGIIYMFSGTLIARLGMGHVPHAAVISILPLVLYQSERWTQNKNIIQSTLLGASLALAILAGHPQYFIYLSYFVLAYLLFRNIDCKKAVKENIIQTSKSLALFFLIAIFASGLSAVYLIQAGSSISGDARLSGSSEDAYEYATTHSLAPYQLLGLFMPDIMGNGLRGTYFGPPDYGTNYIYLGILPLILAVLGIIFRKNSLKQFFFWSGLTALIFSFGKYTLFFRLFYLLPGMGISRVPSRMMMVFSFCIAILAAYGAEFILSKEATKEKKFFGNSSKTLLVIGLVSLISSLITLITKTQILRIGESILRKLYFETYAGTIFVKTNTFESLLAKVTMVYFDILVSLLIFSFIILACSIVLYFPTLKKKYDPALKWMILAIILIDVCVFGFQFVSLEEKGDYFSATPETALLNEDPQTFRIFTTNHELMPTYLTVRQGIQKTLGYGSSRTVYYDYFLENTLSVVDEAHSKTKWGMLTVAPSMLENDYSAKLLGLMNVKYIFSKEKINNSDFVSYGSSIDEYIYKNRLALPKVVVVGNYKVIEDEEKASVFMKSKEFDPISTVVLDKDPQVQTSSEIVVGKITEYKANKITIEVSLENPGILVLSENYYPTWKAYDNGKEVVVYRANQILRAVALEKGEHTVIFKIDRSKYFLGKNISLGSAVLAVLLILTGLIIKSRKSLKRKR